MARAMRRIGDALRLVDVAVEAVDARLPAGGANPILGRMLGRRRRIVALTRGDLAEPATTRAWIEHFRAHGMTALSVDARQARAVGRIATLLAEERKGSVRAIVVGIPNAGKSTLVNALLKRASAKTERRAGVTRATQWFRVAPGVEVMDTPGVLPPKIRSEQTQWKLAAIGAIPQDRFDPEDVVARLADWAAQRGLRRVPDLERFAAERGFMRRGGKVDAHNAAQSYLRAFDHGAFGRISLESPNDAETA
jgi:ribosome biogenesis GTPase A